MLEEANGRMIEATEVAEITTLAARVYEFFPTQPFQQCSIALNKLT
jgi:hypothetical protein|tara:strand:- start:444 stop:581 length:138 start_codon:yes stop_codon:yes gene_type:complete